MKSPETPNSKQIEENLRKGVEAAKKGRAASDKAFDEMFPEKKPVNSPAK